MVKDKASTVDDLIGLLLYEEAWLEQEYLRQQPILSLPPNTTVPVALIVNRASDRYLSFN